MDMRTKEGRAAKAVQAAAQAQAAAQPVTSTPSPEPADPEADRTVSRGGPLQTRNEKRSAGMAEIEAAHLKRMGLEAEPEAI